MNGLKRILRLLKPREQVLMLLFFLGIGLFWFSSAWQRLSDFRNDRLHLVSEEEIQQLWLNREASIRVGLEEVQLLFNPELAYSAPRLSARVDRLARNLEAPFSAEPVRTREGPAFLTHVQRITFQGASLAQLIQFEESLLEERPYLSLEEVRILPRSSRIEYDATFSVTAIEMFTE